MIVTKDTRCDELLKAVGFPGKASFLNPVAGLHWQDFGIEEDKHRYHALMGEAPMDGLTIGQIADIDPNWNDPSMLEGMQVFAQYAVKPGFYHDVYKGTDLEGETALMAMPVPNARRFVVICAGGGYGSCCTMVEAFPLVKPLLEAGISAFVFHYRVGAAAHYPNPMDDLAAAVKYIFKNFDVSEDYGVMGFSAGGHLAATFGTESIGWKKYGLPRPSVMFLGYPVISLVAEYCHGGSRKNLLQEDDGNEALIERYSVDKQATETYPPTFLWQCKGDKSVPIASTQLMDKKLTELGVKHIYEVFDAVGHSWGLGTGTLAEGWLDRAIKFWNEL
ncbi:MAG: alpha/beta hydrolase [Oscillospiraceae bacterium]|nr:alpha/beta hydrolase [Oscillospiraceae bacterium]